MLLVRPDEFGLVPEGGGYYLKDVTQGPGRGGQAGAGVGPQRTEQPWPWPTAGPSAFLIQENTLVPTSGPLPVPAPAEVVPPPAVRLLPQKGPRPTPWTRAWPRAGPQWVVLARTRELASRLGRRQDREPVLITVEAERAMAQGLYFRFPGREPFF